MILKKVLRFRMKAAIVSGQTARDVVPNQEVRITRKSNLLKLFSLLFERYNWRWASAPKLP